MDKQTTAINYFRGHFNCSQSVLTAFGPDYGLSEDESLRIATAFGAGMGRQQHICGAITGALMVLGLRYGKGMNDPEEKKSDTYLKTRKFFDEFKKLNGSVNCRDLLDGLDINNPEDHKLIEERNLFDIRCEKYVSDAVNILIKLTE
ncbi:MAG: C-GCAxxG-C-C family protein [Bacteroidales bacterium]|jgi:C_GCAxxG_C_C family probable redox protein|nr:C-GCAxxG-C-C family protein [Bacteroidales bacterium]